MYLMQRQNQIPSRCCCDLRPSGSRCGSGGGGSGGNGGSSGVVDDIDLNGRRDVGVNVGTSLHARISAEGVAESTSLSRTNGGGGESEEGKRSGESVVGVTSTAQAGGGGEGAYDDNPASAREPDRPLSRESTTTTPSRNSSAHSGSNEKDGGSGASASGTPASAGTASGTPEKTSPPPASPPSSSPAGGSAGKGSRRSPRGDFSHLSSPRFGESATMLGGQRQSPTSTVLGQRQSPSMRGGDRPGGDPDEGDFRSALCIRANQRAGKSWKYRKPPIGKQILARGIAGQL